MSTDCRCGGVLECTHCGASVAMLYCRATSLAGMREQAESETRRERRPLLNPPAKWAVHNLRYRSDQVLGCDSKVCFCTRLALVLCSEQKSAARPSRKRVATRQLRDSLATAASFTRGVRDSYFRVPRLSCAERAPAPRSHASYAASTEFGARLSKPRPSCATAARACTYPCSEILAWLSTRLQLAKYQRNFSSRRARPL